MTFLLDNLTAVVVGTVLIGALFVVQQRAQQSAVEAVQQDRAHAHASGLATTIERELENARSRAETEAAFQRGPGGTPLGDSTYRFRLRQETAADGTVFTSHLSFPTLSAPDSLGVSPVYVVAYHVEDTGARAQVDGRDRSLLRATRYEFARGGPLRETATVERLVDFDVTAVAADGTPTSTAATMAQTPPHLRFDLRYAPEVVAQKTSDQGRGEVTSTRHARTVRVLAAGATSGTAPVVTATPGGIPPLPGDAGYVASFTP
ncbi:hypothetical protein [Rubrivirga sp.]|uniref:hypothetical protein n=1 Tax=Rubrivirga sp. TaxID=1885344 RepID=UPI003B51BD6C